MSRRKIIVGSVAAGIIGAAILGWAALSLPRIRITGNYTLGDVTIDPLFLLTAPISVVVAGILYFVLRRRIQHSWTWWIVIALMLAAGTAPEVFPDKSGGFSHPHIFALIRWFPSCLFIPTFYTDPELRSLRGLAAFFLLDILPFGLAVALWLLPGFILNRWLTGCGNHPQLDGKL